MKLVFKDLKVGKPITLKETITYPKESYEQVYNLRNLISVSAEVTVENYGNLIQIHLSFVAQTELVCSYTLESVPQELKGEETLVLSDEIEDDDIEPMPLGNEMDLDDWILQVLIAHVPMKVIKEGAKLPTFDGVEVLSEDEFNRREQEREDPRFAKLKDWSEDN